MRVESTFVFVILFFFFFLTLRTNSVGPPYMVEKDDLLKLVNSWTAMVPRCVYFCLNLYFLVIAVRMISWVLLQFVSVVV